jgi:malate permease and related proteins
MNNLLLLLFCFSTGYFLRKSGKLPENTNTALNAFIIHLSLPAQIIVFIHAIVISKNLIFAVLMPYLLFGFTLLFLFLIQKIVYLPKKIFACLALTAGLGNTSFMGLPMIETYFGKDALPLGILCDQPGTFLVLSGLGIPLIIFLSDGDKPNVQTVLKKVIFFPPFQAFVLSIFLYNVHLSESFLAILKRLGDTLAPVALFSVGYSFFPRAVSEYKKYLALGLLLKMVLLPLLIYWIYSFYLEKTSLVFQISIFEAAMPPMITAAIVATEYKQEEKLASLMVSFGILFSFLSLFLWQLVLKN